MISVRKHFIVFLIGFGACGRPTEAPRVALQIVPDSSAFSAFVTDLGYRVELTEARAAIADLSFLRAGDAHAQTMGQRAWEFFMPTAHAHPGHAQGGVVTGEMRGRGIVSWLPLTPGNIGQATLLTGEYKSANWTFIRATESDGLVLGDGLLGHTAILRGFALRDLKRVEFVVEIDSPEGRELTGVPFESRINANSKDPLGLRLNLRDLLEDDTMLDGLDFAALDVDGDGQVVLNDRQAVGPLLDAYFEVRRRFQSHDHYDIHLLAQTSP